MSVCRRAAFRTFLFQAYLTIVLRGLLFTGAQLYVSYLEQRMRRLVDGVAVGENETYLAVGISAPLQFLYVVADAERNSAPFV